MSVLQLSRVSHFNGVLTLRLSSNQAVNSVDFWLEFNPADFASGVNPPVRINTIEGWQGTVNSPSIGQLDASAFLKQAGSAEAFAPADTTLMTLVLNLPSTRSDPLILNYGGEVNNGIEQVERSVSIDLSSGSTPPIIVPPPDNGGVKPPEVGVDTVFKELDVGPLQISSQLKNSNELQLILTGDWPVTNFDFYFELPANITQNGIGAPKLTGPQGWSLFSNIENNTLEVSGMAPLLQVGGNFVSNPLQAGEALLTLELQTSGSTDPSLPPIYFSGEMNQDQILVIDKTSLPFTSESPSPQPIFTHWRSKKTLPDVLINADAAPAKIAPNDKNEASIGLSDVLSALKIYLGKPLPAEFTSPFNAVAADFDGSGSVSLNDVLGLLKYYLGKPTGGLEPEWVFVNADASTSGINKNNTNLPDIDLTGPSPELIGILRGDVDGSFSH